MAFIPKDARWYLADLVFEHAVEGDARNVVHVNIHLVEAGSPERAYDKAMELGRAAERVYANTAGREVRVVFRGLRDLNVIHEALEDGAELLFEEKMAVPEHELATWVHVREELSVFRDAGSKREVPNYMPESVMRLLEKAGFEPPINTDEHR